MAYSPSFCCRAALVALGLSLGGLLAGGCGSSGGAREGPPDERFAHRYENAGPEGRRTLTIQPPEPAKTYNDFPVPTDEVIVRVADFEEGASAVPVELLVKGALPNSCLELSKAEQERTGNFLYVTFQMRWPTGPGARCLRYTRPYRFYLPLEGQYAPGEYTLKLNGSVYPFSVRRD